MMFWSIQLVLLSQSLIWGRFIVGMEETRTLLRDYNRHAILVQNRFSRKTASAYLQHSTLIKEGGSNGIRICEFTQAESMWSRGRDNWGVWDSMNIGDVPVFRDIDGVDSIYRLVSEQRERLRRRRLAPRKNTIAPPWLSLR